MSESRFVSALQLQRVIAGGKLSSGKPQQPRAPKKVKPVGKGKGGMPQPDGPAPTRPKRTSTKGVDYSENAA